MRAAAEVGPEASPNVLITPLSQESRSRLIRRGVTAGFCQVLEGKTKRVCREARQANRSRKRLSRGGRKRYSHWSPYEQEATADPRSD